MKVIESLEVSSVIRCYPKDIQDKLLYLRSLIIKAASEIQGLEIIEESLKWGEPSYSTKNGSTIRIDWKEKTPDQYFMYFHCKTRLVDTFKERYSNTFKYEKNRAIIFNNNDNVPVDQLKHCIKLSLTYHSIKHLPMLGI